jgi:hypothetical protein
MLRAHILSFEGYRLYAKELDLYSVVYCCDGYDYIVVKDDKGENKFKCYENSGVPELFKEEISNELPVSSTVEKTEKKEDIITLKKKIVVKKKETTVVTQTQTQTHTTSGTKLSEYHIFIKDFLKTNTDIPWNERMKSANEAWKKNKTTQS